MKKIVLKLDLHDDKAKQKALKTVSTLPGIDSIAMDMKEKKLTVTGVVDPVKVVSKLRKYWPDTTIILLGLAKPAEKAEDAAKKEEGAKKEEEGKKEEGQPAAKEGGGEEEAKKGGSEEADKKKEGEEGKEDQKKPTPPPDPIMELVKAYKAYNPHLTTYYYVPSMEENPNACTIC